jgi:superfamily II DNA/RNA helicase
VAARRSATAATTATTATTTEADEEEDGGGGGTAVGGVILVPTRELCDQVSRVLDDLTYYCADAIKVVVLSSSSSSSFNNGTKGKREMMRQEALLRDRPDVVVATPAGLVAHVRSGALDLRRTVETLVVDEADLILSFGEWMRASVRVRPMILYTRIPLYRVYIYFIPHWMIYNYG